LLYRFSIGGVVLLFLSLSYLLFLLFRYFIQLFKKRKFNFESLRKPENIFLFLISSIVIFSLVALTLSAKKSDRYEILIYPFLILIFTYFLTKINSWIYLFLITLYVFITLIELDRIHPYYLAYSNPLFGGIEARHKSIDNSPFGIGIYKAYQFVLKDRLDNNYDGYFTISGNKSIKEISYGGKFSKYPSCVTDYIITYYKNEQPTKRCVQKYTLLGSVEISGKEYWFIYKRDNQKQESNKE
jgi:hypothetical protein